MESDDDMVLVIVGDDEDENKEYPEPINLEDDSVNCNKESLDSVDIENIIETAATHGEFVYLQIKEEPKEIPYDFDVELVDEDNDRWQGADDDQDYVPQKGESDDEDFDYSSENEDDKQRKKMLKTSQQKSFVKELREQYPELKEDTESLVMTLSEIMRSVKPPPPPQDYFIINGIMFECVFCGTISETIPAASRHYQEKHGERYLVCFACGVDFRSTTNLYKHEKRCVAPDVKIVLKARARALGRKGRSRPYIPKHFPVGSPCKTKSREVKEMYGCPQCPARFVSRSYLRSHELLHRGVRPHRCAHCPAAYTSLAALSRHRKQHSDELYICDHCNRSFKIKAALVTHLNTHLPMKKFGCESCDKRYATKAALVRHVDSVHLNLPPPCVCKICHKRYPRMSILKEHMKKVHGLILMTRRMFFKSLPTMTNTTLEQAKVVLKSELESDNYLPPPPVQNKTNTKPEDQLQQIICKQESVEQIQENTENFEMAQEIVLPEELLQYVESLKANCNEGESYNVMVIDNSEVVNLDDEHLVSVLNQFGCEYCEERYSTREALEYHVNSEHNRPRKHYVCKLCHNRYSRMSALKEHVKKIHGLKLVTQRRFHRSQPPMINTSVQRPQIIPMYEQSQYHVAQNSYDNEQKTEIELTSSEIERETVEQDNTETCETGQEIVLTEELLKYVESLKGGCSDGESYNVVLLDGNSEVVNLNYDDIVNGVHPDYQLVIQLADDGS